MAENNNDKNLIDLQPGGDEAHGKPQNENHVHFEQRLALSDEKTRSRYNAVKNAFMGYAEPKSGIIVSSRTNAYGEDFYLGSAFLGRVRLVRGYVRLFLSLQPKKYPRERYLHHDVSGDKRYAKCPLLINVYSAAAIKNAYSLIGEVMRRSGAAPLSSHMARDWTEDINSSLSARYESFDYADMAAADAAIPDEGIVDDYKEAPPSPKIAGSFYGTPAGESKDGVMYPEDYRVLKAPSPVRMPRRAKVVNAEGEKIGRVRKGVWYDLEGRQKGSFSRTEEKSVYLLRGSARRGFVDAHDNVLTMEGDYRATLKRFPYILLFVFICLLAIVTAVTAVVTSSLMPNSSAGGSYEPIIFVADESGTGWDETENLPIFYNGTFGAEKIAPGMSGSYTFQLENHTPAAINFNLTFTSRNTYGIKLVYTLKRDGAAIAGSPEKVLAEDLSRQNLTIEALSSSVFELEWEWQHDDEADTAAGTSGTIYTLFINFSAERTNADE